MRHVTHVLWLIVKYTTQMHIHSHIHSHTHTHAHTRTHTRALSTGWRRLIGSPKLQIIFHKRATKYTSLLQKMTYKDKGSYESSPLSITHLNHAIRHAVCVYVSVCELVFRILRSATDNSWHVGSMSLRHPLTHTSTTPSDSYTSTTRRGGGLGSRPKKMYGERLGDGVEYHLMSPAPRR